MILIFKRFRGGQSVHFFGWRANLETFSGDGGGCQLKNTLYGCCMDAVLSHVIMRMTWGGLLV